MVYREVELFYYNKYKLISVHNYLGGR